MSFFNGVKRRSEAGIAKDCMATYSLSHGGNQGMTDVEVAYALSAPFSAGVDTVCRSIHSYFQCYGLSGRCSQTLSAIRWSLGTLSAELRTIYRLTSRQWLRSAFPRFSRGCRRSWTASSDEIVCRRLMTSGRYPSWAHLLKK